MKTMRMTTPRGSVSISYINAPGAFAHVLDALLAQLGYEHIDECPEMIVMDISIS